MEFIKYQHIERFGTSETNGIENGVCYIFPKIDGTNSQLWLNGGIKAGSRNRELSLENDNAGFYSYATKQLHILNFLHAYPNLRLFGEWLVPHTLKTYHKEAWNRFYVFDIMRGEKYLPYDEYKPLLDEYNIEYIPPICKVKNPTYERLINQLEKNTYLIEDGSGTGEGIVIKNYDFINKYGITVWAKIVKNEFKASHQKCNITEIKESEVIEQKIVNKYITKSLIEKEYNKILVNGEWKSKLIPQLLNTVYYCLIKEESWNFIKEFKRPVIDFRRLLFYCTEKIKELMPELF